MNFEYSENNYDTPTDYPKFFFDKLACRTRAFFYYRIIKLVLDTTRIIKKGKYSDEAWSESSYYAFRTVEGCGGKIHIKNMDNIEKHNGPVVFIGNHMSILETFLLPGIICPRRSISFVVKKSLVDYPVFGLVMRATKPIVVERKNPIKDLKAVINDGSALLKTGRSVIIFPQSTRSSKFKVSEFNSIGIKLAKKAGVPVVPIALKTNFWGNGSFIKDLGPVNREKETYIEFGEPINIEGNGKAEHNKIIDFIETKLVEWNH
jgi:1-acyl-sn-glycerol-3-phosphate acyltransferase